MPTSNARNALCSEQVLDDTERIESLASILARGVIRLRHRDLKHPKAVEDSGSPGLALCSAIVLRCVEKHNDDPLPRCHVCNWHLDYDGSPLPQHVKVFMRGDH